MSDLSTLADKAKSVSGSLTAYTTLGSFALYFIGYLSLRFRLTALGINTDLAVFDERYLFAGAAFAAYLIVSWSSAVLLSLVFAGLGYVVYKAVAALTPRSSHEFPRNRLWAYLANPSRLTLAGIVLSVVLIQFIMRQCLQIQNLLLARPPLEPGWLGALLSSESYLADLFFCGLLVGTGVCGVLYFAGKRQEPQTALSRRLGYLLASLLAIEILLLPVNFGVLLWGGQFPRVASLGGQETLKPVQEAWMIWEGKDWTTYLVRTRDGGNDLRALVSLPNKDKSRIQVTCYDAIFRILFSGEESACSGGTAPERKSP